MFKTLDRFKYIFLFMVMVQVMIIFIAKFWFDLDTIPMTFLASLMLFNLFIILGFNLAVAKGAKSEYVTTKWALSFDISETLKFSETGMISYDENMYISWVSDFMSARGLTEIIGQKIFDWCPDLKLLWNKPNSTIKIELESQKYSVKFIKETRTFVFKDVTNYESLFNTYTDEGKCFGFLVIDNYQEVIKTADEDLKIKISTIIGETVSLFSSKYKAFVRSTAPDQYTILMDYKSFKAAKHNKFELFNEFKEKAKKYKINISLTTGFSYGHASIQTLIDLSSSALDLGRSRGGDQVVIRAFGKPTEFLGGESEAKFGSSRVRIRNFAKDVGIQIENANNIVVMGHQMGDFDTVGASCAIIAIANHFKKKVKWAVDIERLDVKARNAVIDYLPTDFQKEHIIKPSDATKWVDEDSVVIIVDTHIPSRIEQPKVAEMAKNIIVIDHHRKSEYSIDKAVSTYIEPSASSTCEIMTEIINYQDQEIHVPQHVLDMMLTGIILDTNHFRMRTSTRTFDASAALKKLGADPIIADEFLKDTIEDTQLKASIISTMEEIKEGISIAIAPGETKVQGSELAQVAQMLLSIKGTKAAIVLGNNLNDQVAISIRTDGSINGQVIAEELGGGGHFTAAGAQVNDTTIEQTRDKITNIIRTGKRDLTVKE